MDLIKTNKRWLVPLAAFVALALGVTIGLSIRSWRTGGEAVASLVYLDVNPSIQLQLSQKEEVLAALPMNEEARAVLADMELQGTSLNVAVNAIMGSLLQHGYLSGKDAAILISVEDQDTQRAARLEEDLNRSVSAAVSSALVLSQVVDAGETAQNGVSAGKAALIRDIQDLNGSLDFDALAALTAEELWQLRDAGAPGMPIGISAAAHAAETYAGTLEVDSVTYEADPELDEIPAHYEIELRLVGPKEFDYKIDAYTGEVLQGPADILNSAAQAGSQDNAAQDPVQTSPVQTAPIQTAPTQTTPVQPAPAPSASGTPASSSGSVSEEEAKSIAYTHAGVQASEVSQLKCKLDWDDGVQVYEIEFWAGNVEYEYEILVSNGSIHKAEQDHDNNYPSSGSSAGSSSGGSHHTACIGDNAAKEAAFRHAGVSASSASRIECELDWDDGVYEVEFRVDGVEYKYEINASTGAVVKAEQDR